METTLMEKLSRDAYPAGGEPCPGCGSRIGGQIILRALANHENVWPSGGSCGFAVGAAGANEANMGHGSGAIMGMTGASLTGLVESMRLRGITDKKLVVVSGEAAATTMGLGATLHAFMRQLPFTLIIMNNEYYAQSGYHLSGRSPLKANDRVLPMGKQQPSDPVPLMMGVAGAKYTATATLGFPEDLVAKIDTALEHQPSYVEVLAPCESGWRYPVGMTVELTRLAVQTDLYPLWEWLSDEGETRFRKTVLVDNEERASILEYTKHQRRFQHLSEGDVADMNAFIDNQLGTLEKMEKGFN